MTCGLALIKRVSRERPWPRSAKDLLPPVRLQDFFRNSPRTDDRAVDRRVLAIRLGGFPREEERRVEWRPQLLPRPAAAHRGITVGAAREGIGLPVVTESPPESLLHADRVQREKAGQGVERDADALRLAQVGERPRIGTRRPARHHGKRRWAGEPPDGKRRFDPQKNIAPAALARHPPAPPPYTH